MNIKQSVYDNLNPSQRASAMLEAVKRGDSTEAKRLMGSVERKIYEQADTEFSDRLISQMLADDTFEDKAGAYKTLLAFINRKESAGRKEYGKADADRICQEALARVLEAKKIVDEQHRKGLCE